MNQPNPDPWENSVEAALNAIMLEVTNIRRDLDAVTARLEQNGTYEQLKHEVMKLGGRVNALYNDRANKK
jgi:hypothetical protein